MKKLMVIVAFFGMSVVSSQYFLSQNSLNAQEKSPIIGISDWCTKM